MNNEIQKRLLVAVEGCLRPLVRMLVRSGISYRQFDEIAKSAFVGESLNGGDHSKKRTNVSRIAVRTGLSRKEIARIRNLLDESGGSLIAGEGAKSHSSLAARVLQIWHTDPRFADSSGRPRALTFTDDPRSFSELVRLVGGDVPAGAVRAELLAADAAAEDVDGTLRALKRHFIPGDLDEDMVVGFSQIVTPLLEALAHNCQNPKEDAFFQRVAYSDSMAFGMLPKLRKFAFEHASAFVHKVDDWLGANEDGGNSSSTRQPRVGVGVFYFEEKSPRSD